MVEPLRGDYKTQSPPILEWTKGGQECFSTYVDGERAKIEYDGLTNRWRWEFTLVFDHENPGSKGTADNLNSAKLQVASCFQERRIWRILKDQECVGPLPPSVD